MLFLVDFDFAVDGFGADLDFEEVSAEVFSDLVSDFDSVFESDFDSGFEVSDDFVSAALSLEVLSLLGLSASAAFLYASLR